jgi:hypothetical protein
MGFKLLLIQLWSGSAFAITLYFLGYLVYYYYTIAKIERLLKEKNPERLSYLNAERVSGWGNERNTAIRERYRKWLRSDMDNEFLDIRLLKDGIVKYEKVGKYCIIYMLVTVIIGFLLNFIGVW